MIESSLESCEELTYSILGEDFYWIGILFAKLLIEKEQVSSIILITI